MSTNSSDGAPAQKPQPSTAGLSPKAVLAAKRAAKRTARARRYVMCGVELDALQACHAASDGAVMVRYARETGAELARRPRTQAAIAAQARVDNAEARAIECATFAAAVEGCRRLAVEQGRLKSGELTNPPNSPQSKLHRAWVDALTGQTADRAN